MFKRSVMILLLVSFTISGWGNMPDPAPGCRYPQYKEIKQRLIRGWNTWNTRSVLQHVLLPEGFALNLAFKQHYWLEEKYLGEALIGRRGNGVEEVRPGPHAYDGSYTCLDITWETLEARVESASDGDGLVVLITPARAPSSPVKMVVETGMLWNRPGSLAKDGDTLTARLPERDVRVFVTAPHAPDPYIPLKTPHISVFVKGQPIAISTGIQRDVEAVRALLDRRRDELSARAARFGDLADAFVAIQAGIAWNTIYEPKEDRVVSTVGRLWNQEYGGYCLFGWDNFFLAYMTSLASRDLAFANVIEHLRGATEEGFIPNDNRGNGSKSWDRSQPPVGAVMVKEIYKRYPERWFLEATFDGLLAWNRWWVKKRLNGGLLSYGSHEAKNPFNEPAVRTKRTAGYESGMDDSPMYTGVPFNKEKNTLELQDVGLSSLYIADCKALAEMAGVLGRKKEQRELKLRARRMAKKMAALWHPGTGLYLNRRTDSGEFSFRLSPTLFYPLLAGVPSQKRAGIMLKHFFDPNEFYGEWMLPSIARNDPDFKRQRYWKGAIWPPLNFLTYLSLRQYGMTGAQRELAEKSLRLLLDEWKRKGYVSENYSSITGTGDDSRLSSDRFHSWGALFGIISFIDKGFMPPPEKPLR